MAVAVGLDLGHTNLRLASVQAGGQPALVTLGESGRQMPSLVAVGTGGLLYGQAALRQSIGQPETAIRDLVSRFARGGMVSLGQTAASVDQVLASLLRQALEAVPPATASDVTRLAVAMPASWSEPAAARLAAIGNELGYELALVRADLAAPMGSSLRPAPDSRRLLVLDLGGEQCVASMVLVEERTLTPLALARRDHIAGRSFTDHIVELASSQAAELVGYDLRHQRKWAAQMPIRAEAAKLTMTSAPKATMDLGDLVEEDGQRLALRVTINTSDFEDMIESSVAEALEAAREVARGGQPTDLLLVGGSCQIPFVRKRVQSAFGQAHLHTGPPAHLTALGASLFAAGGLWRVGLPVANSAPVVGVTPEPSQAVSTPEFSTPPMASPGDSGMLPVLKPGQTMTLTLRAGEDGLVSLAADVSGRPSQGPAPDSPTAQVPAQSGSRWVAREHLDSGTGVERFSAIDKLSGRRVRWRRYDPGNELSRTLFLGNLNTVGIDHPNLAQLLDFGLEENHLFVVTSSAEWPTLKDAALASTAESGTFGLSVAWRLVRMGSAGVSALHDRRVCHRNLKPANLLVSPELDDLRVTDCDYSLHLAPGQVVTEIVGTVPYMAPEVLGRRGDLRGDVYALGVILFELLTGSLPFAGDNQRELIEAICNQPTPRASFFRPDLPPAVDELLLRLLDKDPDGRPKDASTLVAVLDEGTPATEADADGVAQRNVDPGRDLRQPQDEWEVQR